MRWAWYHVLGISIGVVLLLAGWREFLFLTDDAYIFFRYVSNSLLGHGLVWNPEPFHPVEGYTSFLWVLLLKWTWQITGIPPDESANHLSLLFGFGQLTIGILMGFRMRLPSELAPKRFLFLCLVIFATITNRTFLTWLSSGLETSLFNFCLTGWLYFAFTRSTDRNWKWAFLLSTTAAATSLSRPEGVLTVGLTGCILGIEAIRNPGIRREGLRFVAGFLPLLATPGHFLWRYATYGEWLPNTYYAKHLSPWPESGGRYFLTFVIEYGLWIWILALAAFVASRFPMIVRSFRALHTTHYSEALAVGFVAFHWAFYTFSVGGDHFEFRIYSHLILLTFLSFLWLLSRIRLGWKGITGLLLLFTLASYPIPWTHHHLTKDIRYYYAADVPEEMRGTRAGQKTAYQMFVMLAGHFPKPASHVVEWYDAMQHWLITHYVGMRHQEHKAFLESQRRRLPDREQGSAIPSDGYPVLSRSCVGLASWVLPHVNIIDRYGLNDWVIARNPHLMSTNRRMAHDRMPPEGYIECFKENVVIEDDGRVTVNPRAEPLTADAIRECTAIQGR